LVEPRKLKGFRDFGPAEAAVRQAIIDKITVRAERAAFQSISTPAIEYSEVLMGSGGGETDKEVYQFSDQGDRLVALRYDLTVPFARFVAEHYSELTFPFKKLQIGEVWRGEKPQKGRYRQFCQADLDIIGSDSLRADVEVISLFAQILDELIPKPFTISLSNRKILSHILSCFIPNLDPESEKSALIALDKLGKIGATRVTELMKTNDVLGKGDVEGLLKFVAAGEKDAVFRLRKLSPSEEFQAEIAKFERTLELLKLNTRGLRCKVAADLSLARGLAYYTGAVFETLIDGFENIGSICSGGRYDKLVSRFMTEELSGIGGTIGVDRLLVVLMELGMKSQKQPQFFVAVAGQAAEAYAYDICRTLREAGYICDMDLKERKLAAQFKHANRLGIPRVITVGDEEVAARTFSLKDMVARTEAKAVPFANLLKLAAESVG
jgi:histidyl-tRNA synthetase